jgi:hypothetical protein
VSGVRDAVQAAELWKEVTQSADPGHAAQRILDRLEHQAENAEAWQVSEEQFLAEAVERMERAAHARQRAARAAAEQRRVEGLRRREMERRRKNARARERYRQQRLNEVPRVDHRIGMHALAIQVDPTAYRTVKMAAYRANTSIPRLLGEILHADLSMSGAPNKDSEPRWRRTGEGRRAKQHTRIDVAASIWEVVHIDAFRQSLTVARRVGLAIERWAWEEEQNHSPR